MQRRSGGDEFYEEINTLIGGDVTAQQLIAEARKYPVSHRGRIYEAAASKFASQGDFDGARQLIEDNFSDQALDQAMNNLNSNRFYQLQNQGKFTEAELLIDTLPEGNQFSSLVSLAHAVYQRNPEENRAYAAGLLVKARSMLPERPETSSEMQNMLQLISAAVNLDIDEAFRLFAAITPQMNEVTEASLIVNAFHNNYNIRDGEMIISNGNPSGLYIDSNLMERLAEKDFDRTMVLIDGFSRRESRISLKLQLAERGGFRNLHVITTSHGSQRGRH